MKKNTTFKKLSLSRETLNILNDSAMIAVLGGAVPDTHVKNTQAGCCLG